MKKDGLAGQRPVRKQEDLLLFATVQLRIQHHLQIFCLRRGQSFHGKDGKIPLRSFQVQIIFAVPVTDLIIIDGNSVQKFTDGFATQQNIYSI